LYWGSFLHCKGVHILADALPGIFGATDDLHVVLVGAKPQQDGNADAMERRLRACGSSHPERLHILPPLEEPELLALIGRARVAVLPSILDNLPNTLLEAMHVGAIIVATAGASLDELVTDGIHGWLVECGNSEQLIAAIGKADQMSEADRMVMSQAAKARVQEVCGPEKVMNRVVALCGDAITTYARR
jgi:glycosyltransferase involved in cell wall biosynthesis